MGSVIGQGMLRNSGMTMEKGYTCGNDIGTVDVEQWMESVDGGELP